MWTFSSMPDGCRPSLGAAPPVTGPDGVTCHPSGAPTLTHTQVGFCHAHTPTHKVLQSGDTKSFFFFSSPSLSPLLLFFYLSSPLRLILSLLPVRLSPPLLCVFSRCTSSLADHHRHQSDASLHLQPGPRAFGPRCEAGRLLPGEGGVRGREARWGAEAPGQEPPHLPALPHKIHRRRHG